MPAGHLAQGSNRRGNYKFGILPGKMPRKANKTGLDDHIFRGSIDLQTHSFIANSAIASGKLQRVADVLGSGRDVKQLSRFSWVCLLSEMQPEFTISECLSRVLKELALRQSRDATLTVVDVAFRDASAHQQRGYRDIAFAKSRNRLPSGEPGRAW
jgi:hypothetical protein